MRERIMWISAGLLGLLLAAALASATSRVTRPDVGLAGEPVSAGEALAPPARVTAPAARAVARRPQAPAKKRAKKRATPAAKRRAARTPAAALSRARRSPSLATSVSPAVKAPATRRKRGSSRATATVGPAKPAVARPTAPAPVLTTPTLTVEDHGGDRGDRGDSSGKGKGRDGGGDD